MAITLTVTSGNNQLIPMNLGNSSFDIIINVLNAGAPVVGATVVFTAATTPPIGYPGATTTDASGNLTVRMVAQTQVSSSPSITPWVVTASYGGSSTTFTETYYFESTGLVPGIYAYRLAPAADLFNPYKAQAGVAGTPIKIQILRADGVGGVPDVGVKLIPKDDGGGGLQEVINTAEATGPEGLVLTDASGIATLTPTFVSANTALGGYPSATETFDVNMGRFNKYSPLEFQITTAPVTPPPAPAAITQGGNAVTILPDFYGYDIANDLSGEFGFEYGGALYLFLRQGGFGTAYPGDFKIHALKSTDTGLTWNELDAANAPATPNSAPGGDYTIARDGTTVFFITDRLSTVAGGLTVRKFDLLTMSWGASVNSVITGFDYNNVNSVFYRLLVRGASDYILYFSSTQETVSGTSYIRCSYATFDGTTFGAAVHLPGQVGTVGSFEPMTACVDSSKNCHLVYYFGDNARTLLDKYCHVCLQPGNTFGSVTTVIPHSESDGSIYYAIPFSSEIISYISDGVERIALVAQANWSPTSFDEGIVLYYAGAVVNPTWTRSIITHDSVVAQLTNYYGFQNSGRYLTLTAFAGGLTAVWCFNDDGGGSYARSSVGHFYYSQASAIDLVWTAPAKLWDAGIIADAGQMSHGTEITNTPLTCGQVISFPTTSGIGICGMSQDQQALLERAQFYRLPGFVPSSVPGTGSGIAGCVIPPSTGGMSNYGVVS